MQGVGKAGKSKVVNGHVRGVQSVSSTQKMGAAAIQEDSNRVIEVFVFPLHCCWNFKKGGKMR